MILAKLYKAKNTNNTINHRNNIDLKPKNAKIGKHGCKKLVAMETSK